MFREFAKKFKERQREILQALRRGESADASVWERAWSSVETADFVSNESTTLAAPLEISPVEAVATHPRMQTAFGGRGRFLALSDRRWLVRRLLAAEESLRASQLSRQRGDALSAECSELRSALERAQQERLEAEGRLLCILCFDKPRRVALLPCLHFYFCARCGGELRSTCPLCRTKIARKLLLRMETDQEASESSQASLP